MSLIQTVHAQADNLSDHYTFGGYGSFGQLVSNIIPVIFTVATIAVVFYFVIAAFKLITSGGDKEAVSSARGMITHAVVGFVLLMVVFLLVQLIPDVLGIELNII